MSSTALLERSVGPTNLRLLVRKSSIALSIRRPGLGFILESLARFGQTGTFFTEALQCAYFGDAPMQCSAQRIAAAGHDVQLHLHPCWLHFRNNDWRQPGFTPNDSCAGRTDKELDKMITLGFGAFARWGIPPPITLSHRRISC